MRKPRDLSDRKKRSRVLFPVLLPAVVLTLLAGCTQPSPTPTPAPTATATVTPISEDPAFTVARQELVAYAVQVQGLQNQDVIAALGAVPRHEFVPEDYIDLAYEDMPLPIGYGQTISQPSLVAWMTELLELEPGDKVLEIGTGSGYQAAILAELGYVEVYSIEIVPELYERCSELLGIKGLGYLEINLMQGDGYYGWEDHAPYDAIIVTAAPDHIPQPLVAQLADGGRMVIPVGPPGGYQVLWLLERAGDEVRQSEVMGVAFVPLTRRGEPGGVEQA